MGEGSVQVGCLCLESPPVCSGVASVQGRCSFLPQSFLSRKRTNPNNALYAIISL